MESKDQEHDCLSNTDLPEPRGETLESPQRHDVAIAVRRAAREISGDENEDLVRDSVRQRVGTILAHESRPGTIDLRQECRGAFPIYDLSDRQYVSAVRHYPRYADGSPLVAAYADDLRTIMGRNPAQPVNRTAEYLWQVKETHPRLWQQIERSLPPELARASDQQTMTHALIQHGRLLIPADHVRPTRQYLADHPELIGLAGTDANPAAIDAVTRRIQPIKHWLSSTEIEAALSSGEGQQVPEVWGIPERALADRDAVTDYIQTSIRDIQHTPSGAALERVLEREGLSFQDLVERPRDFFGRHSDVASKIHDWCQESGCRPSVAGTLVHRFMELRTMHQHPDEVVAGLRKLEHRIDYQGGYKRLDGVLIRGDTHYIYDYKPVNMADFMQTEAGQTYIPLLEREFGADYPRKLTGGIKHLPPDMRQAVHDFITETNAHHRRQLEPYKYLYAQAAGLSDDQVKGHIRPYFVYR